MRFLYIACPARGVKVTDSIESEGLLYFIFRVWEGEDKAKISLAKEGVLCPEVLVQISK